MTSAPPPALRDAFALQTLEYFRARTGADATHLVYAPGRVNVIGEHTDYNGGFVLPMAIELGVYIAARPRADRRVRAWSLQLEGPPAEFDAGDQTRPTTHSWSNYLRGVIAGLYEAGLETPGFDAVIHASLPAGGGLSSSAALEIATATLGEALTGRKLDPEQKALLCQKAEHVFAGMPCGIMDQFAVTFGRQGHLLLLDCQSQQRRLVPMNGADTTLLVINTMVKHELTDGGYASRRDDCHEAARLLGVKELRDVTVAQVHAAEVRLPARLYRRARHVVTENARTLAAVDAIQRGAWPEVGRLMYASHASLRNDFEVSCAELDLVVETAGALGVGGGVYGCRMTGGGFGGCCVALVRTADAAKVEQVIAETYRQKINLEPNIFATRPADGPAVLLEP
ncbi:MAG TPA: galactokinase [Chthoniobacteraceae bacterium]|jgi:galactokinase